MVWRCLILIVLTFNPSWVIIQHVTSAYDSASRYPDLKYDDGYGTEDSPYLTPYHATPSRPAITTLPETRVVFYKSQQKSPMQFKNRQQLERESKRLRLQRTKVRLTQELFRIECALATL